MKHQKSSLRFNLTVVGACDIAIALSLAASAPVWSQEPPAPLLTKPPKVAQPLPPVDAELLLLPSSVEAIATPDPSEVDQGSPAVDAATAPEAGIPLTIDASTAPLDSPTATVEPLVPTLPPPVVTPQPQPNAVQPNAVQPNTAQVTVTPDSRELDSRTPDSVVLPVTPAPPAPAPEPVRNIPAPTPPLPQPPGYQVQPYQDRPTNEFNQYRLSIGDGINILVVGFPEFSTQGSINLEGTILIPILGPRDFQGFTLADVERQVSYELGQQYLREPPDVIVSLLNPRPASITVTGEVVEPGFYEVAPGSDPFDAIFRAGGVRPTGDQRSVLVRRTLLDGTVIEETIDLLTPLQTGSPLESMFLLHGDAIVVSRLTPEQQAEYDHELAARNNLGQATITVRVFNKPGNRLGAIQLPNGSTFVDALTALSPNTTEAKLSSIALIRFDPEQGRPVAQKLNGRRALLGDSTQDVLLEHDDVIVVGRSLIADVSNALNQFTRPFRDVLGFLLFFREIGNSADSIFSP